MEYLFETHMHTSQGSACGRDSGADMARAYHKSGYAGMVVTDHFFNGNTAVSGELPWRERIERFTEGFLDAKSEGGKLGLTVLFGWEFNTGGAEFLTFGLEPDFLYANPDIDRLGVQEYIELVQRSGGFLSQAHPFRERDYLYGLHLYPEADAVEVINSAHEDPQFDRRAYAYAVDRNKIMTSGSDMHGRNWVNGTGMVFREKIKNNRDFIAALKKGSAKLILRGSEYNPG